MRDPENPKILLLRCSRVSGSLELVEGWKTNAALSAAPAVGLPADLSDWPPEEAMHPARLLPPEELRYPIHAELRDPDTIAFHFASPIKRGELFHWCFAYGSNPEGVNVDVQPSLTGIRDESGVTLASAALMPVR